MRSDHFVSFTGCSAEAYQAVDERVFVPQLRLEERALLAELLHLLSELHQLLRLQAVHVWGFSLILVVLPWKWHTHARVTTPAMFRAANSVQSQAACLPACPSTHPVWAWGCCTGPCAAGSGTAAGWWCSASARSERTGTTPAPSAAAPGHPAGRHGGKMNRRTHTHPHTTTTTAQQLSEFTCSRISSLYWVTMLSCCSRVFFTSSSFFSSSLDLCTALVIIPVMTFGQKSNENPPLPPLMRNNLKSLCCWTRLTDPPAPSPAWWTRGRRASALAMGRQAAASGLPENTARVWWWSPVFPQSSPFQCASRWAASAFLWGGRRRHTDQTQ